MTKTIMSLPQAVMAAARAAGSEEADDERIAQDDALVAYLKDQAMAVPGSFLTLLGKVGMGQEAKVPPPIIRIELVAPKIGQDEKRHE